MLEKLLSWERDAFLWLNGGHTPYWDEVMYLYSGKLMWIPAAACILLVICYGRPWREWILTLLLLVLVITLCDQFSSHVCKPLFTRYRPTHHPDFASVVSTVHGYRGGMYGFISGHATNALGFATYTLLLFRDRRYTWSIAIWSLLMMYSRIYLGVHFISDLIPGALSGILFGWFGYYLLVHLRSRLSMVDVCYYGRREVSKILTVLLISILFCLSYGAILTGL